MTCTLLTVHAMYTCTSRKCASRSTCAYVYMIYLHHVVQYMCMQQRDAHGLGARAGARARESKDTAQKTHLLNRWMEDQEDAFDEELVRRRIANARLLAALPT